MSEIETILARGKPLICLLDEFAVSALIAHNLAIGNLIPQDEQTIYEKYVIPHDRLVSSKLTKIMAQVPGLINLAFDGATINGEQKVIYTVSKGEFSSFHNRKRSSRRKSSMRQCKKNIQLKHCESSCRQCSS